MLKGQIVSIKEVSDAVMYFRFSNCSYNNLTVLKLFIEIFH